MFIQYLSMNEYLVLDDYFAMDKYLLMDEIIFMNGWIYIFINENLIYEWIFSNGCYWGRGGRD